jgi:single-strand DNA-binding protein
MAGEPLVTVTGRIGSDPDVNFTQAGKAIAKFSLACTPFVKDGAEWVEKDTIWFRVSLWKNAEEFVEAAVKGSLVTLSGRLNQRTYETKAGESRTELNLDADAAGIVPVKAKSKKIEAEPEW